MKKTNLSWVRKVLGYLIIIQFIPLITGVIKGNYWDEKEKYNESFDWPRFWDGYSWIYVNIYVYIFIAGTLLFLAWLCLAPANVIKEKFKPKKDDY